MGKLKSSRITITKIQIGEFELPVPHGLSELVNSAGAWGEKKDELTYLKEYDRTVEMRDGTVFTVLTRKK